LTRAPTPKPAVPPEWCKDLDVSRFQFPEKLEGEWKLGFGDFQNLLGEWRGVFDYKVIELMITNQGTGARRLVSYDVDTPLSEVKKKAIQKIGYDLPWLAEEDFKLGPLDGTVKDAYLDETKTLKDLGYVNRDELLIWFDGV